MIVIGHTSSFGFGVIIFLAGFDSEHVANDDKWLI